MHRREEKSRLFFSEIIGKSPLLLGRLMIGLKGWREARKTILPIAQLREKAVYQYTTHPYLAIGKQGKL